MKKLTGVYAQEFEAPEMPPVKEPNPNYVPPASVRQPVNKQSLVSETITISVAEYHFLTKAATLLEAIMHTPAYTDQRVQIEAARKCIYFSEAGAEE